MRVSKRAAAFILCLALAASSVPLIATAEDIPPPSPYDNTVAAFDKIFFLEERTSGNVQAVVNEDVFPLFNRLSDSGVPVSDSAVFLLADAGKIAGARSAIFKFTSFVHATVTSIDMELYVVPPTTSADLAAKLREPLVPATTYFQRSSGSDTEVAKYNSPLYGDWNGIKTAAIAAASANKKYFRIPVSLTSNGYITTQLDVTDRLDDMAAAVNADGKILLMLTNFVRGGSGNFSLEGRYFGSANGTILPHIAIEKDAEALQGMEGDFAVIEQQVSATKLIRTNNGRYTLNTFADSTHSYNPLTGSNAAQVYIPADLSQYTDAAEYIEKVYLKIPGRLSGTNAGHISVMGYDNLSLSALTNAAGRPTDEQLRQHDSTAVKLGVYKSEDDEILADVTGYVKAQISAGKPLMFATREAAVLFSQTRPAPSMVLYFNRNIFSQPEIIGEKAGFSVSDSIKIGFSTAMDTASFQNVTVEKSGAPVNIEVTPLSNRVFEITSGWFEPDSLYEIVFSGVENYFGGVMPERRLSFRTQKTAVSKLFFAAAEFDKTHLADIPVDAGKITVQFNEAMDIDSYSSIEVQTAEGVSISSVDYDESDERNCVITIGDLELETNYVLVVSGARLGNLANTLMDDAVYPFTTQSAGVAYYNYVDPVSGEKKPLNEAPISVREIELIFNVPIENEAVSEDTIKLYTEDGVSVSAALSKGGEPEIISCVLSMQPGTFKANSSYSIETSGFAAVAKRYTFTTERTYDALSLHRSVTYAQHADEIEGLVRVQGVKRGDTGPTTDLTDGSRIIATGAEMPLVTVSYENINDGTNSYPRAVSANMFSFVYEAKKEAVGNTVAVDGTDFTAANAAEVWFYDNGSDGAVFTNEGYGISMQSGKDVYSLTGGGDTSILRAAGWHQVVFDCTIPGFMSVYIDGEAVDTISGFAALRNVTAQNMTADAIRLYQIASPITEAAPTTVRSASANIIQIFVSSLSTHTTSNQLMQNGRRYAGLTFDLHNINDSKDHIGEFLLNLAPTTATGDNASLCVYYVNQSHITNSEGDIANLADTAYWLNGQNNITDNAVMVAPNVTAQSGKAVDIDVTSEVLGDLAKGKRYISFIVGVNNSIDATVTGSASQLRYFLKIPKVSEIRAGNVSISSGAPSIPAGISNISVKFTYPMDVGSITAGLGLYNGALKMTNASVSAGADGKSATIAAPPGSFKSGETYTVKLRGIRLSGAVDPASFVADVLNYDYPFTVEGIKATGVSELTGGIVSVTQKSFTVSFSKDIDFSTVTAENIWIEDAGGQLPNFTLQAVGAKTVRIVIGGQNLKAKMSYTIKISNRVRDIGGGRCASSSYSFITETPYSFIDLSRTVNSLSADAPVKYTVTADGGASITNFSADKDLKTDTRFAENVTVTYTNAVGAEIKSGIFMFYQPNCFNGFEDGTVSPKRTGSAALTLKQVNNAENRVELISKTSLIPTVDMAEVWFYDSLSPNSAGYVKNEGGIGAGIKAGANLYALSDDTLTQVARRGGWHQIVFDYRSEGELLIYIDAAKVYEGSYADDGNSLSVTMPPLVALPGDSQEMLENKRGSFIVDDCRLYFTGNRPPRLGSSGVLVEQSDSGVSAVYTFIDDDGDKEKDSVIRWYVNGARISAYDGALKLTAGNYKTGDEVYVTVVPSDNLGLKGDEYKSASLKIGASGGSGPHGGGPGGGGGNGGRAGAAVTLPPPGSDAEQTGKSGFADVPSGHWATAEINTMRDAGILRGVDNERFLPDQNVTRAEFLAALLRALAIPEMEAEDISDDVKAGDWYAKAVTTAYKIGIASGYDGRFRPNDFIVREEMAKLIVDALEKTKNNAFSVGEITFTDKDNISDWAYGPVAKAVGTSLLRGRADGSFDSRANTTRAEMAVVLYRIVEVAL